MTSSGYTTATAITKIRDFLGLRTGRTIDAPPEYELWFFDPQPDITAHELAQILKYYGGSTQIGYGRIGPLAEGFTEKGAGPDAIFPADVARHFWRGDQ